MVFGFGAYVNERKVQQIGYQCALRDGSCGHAGDSVGFGETLGNEASYLDFYEIAQFRVRQCFAIVAIKWGFPSGSPCERIGRLKFDGFDLKQLSCENLL